MLIHEHLQGQFISWTAVLHKLLQHGSHLHGLTNPPRTLLQHGLLSPRVCRSFQVPAPAQVSHGVTASTQASPCSGTGSSAGATLHCMGCRGPAISPRTALQNLRAISFSPSSSSCPSSCSALCWLCAQLFLSHVLTLPFPGHSYNYTITDFLKTVIPKALPPFLTGPALSGGRSVLELAGADSAGHGGVSASNSVSQKVLT